MRGVLVFAGSKGTLERDGFITEGNPFTELAQRNLHREWKLLVPLALDITEWHLKRDGNSFKILD